MNSLKVLKKYIIDSQLFVAIMGTALAYFFMLEESIVKLPTLLLIFITYFSGYLYTKYQRPPAKMKLVLSINILAGLCSGVLIYLNHNEIRLLKWLIIVALGLCYNSSFLKMPIRKIPFLKIFYVGLVWALINSWLILPQFRSTVFLITFFYIVALILPFDIRDSKLDDVPTLPQALGIVKTKYLAGIFLFLVIILSNIALSDHGALAFSASCIISFIMLLFSNSNRRDAFYTFGVEFCVGLPLLFLLLLQ